jgi:hypothetical protein
MAGRPTRGRRLSGGQSYRSADQGGKGGFSYSAAPSKSATGADPEALASAAGATGPATPDIAPPIGGGLMGFMGGSMTPGVSGLGPVEQTDYRMFAPVSTGGMQPGTMSMGNPLHGTINLGGLLGPRANPNFNPNDTSSNEMPYQNPGFFRRMFGDTGQLQNQQFVAGANQSALNEKYAAQDFQRKAALAQQLKQWELQMEAAKANQVASTHLQAAQVPENNRLQIAREKEAADLFQMTGTHDPIMQQEILRQRGSVMPVGGSAFMMTDPTKPNPTLIGRHGGTPGFWDVSGGTPKFNPPTEGNFGPINTGNEGWGPESVTPPLGTGGPAPGTQQPTGGALNITPEEKALLLQGSGRRTPGASPSAAAPQTPGAQAGPQIVQPFWKRLMLGR